MIQSLEVVVSDGKGAWKNYGRVAVLNVDRWKMPTLTRKGDLIQLEENHLKRGFFAGSLKILGRMPNFRLE